MMAVKIMKIRILIVLAVLIFAVGIAGSIIVLNSPPKSCVNVVQGGRVIYRFDLDKTEDKTFDVEYHGSKNTIEIKDGKIRVKSAECPDKTCVHMGWLQSSAMPIVCLPNHLVIEIVGDDSEIDALSE